MTEHPFSAVPLFCVIGPRKRPVLVAPPQVQPHETLIQEYLELPLKDSVKEKWLYGNAARVFGFE